MRIRWLECWRWGVGSRQWVQVQWKPQDRWSAARRAPEGMSGLVSVSGGVGLLVWWGGFFEIENFGLENQIFLLFEFSLGKGK